MKRSSIPAARPCGRGFTLIELIAAILVMAVLAIAAVPALTDLRGEARYSTMASLTESIASAANLVHSKAMAANQTGATGTVTINGVAIATVYGYPAATDTGIQRALTLPTNTVYGSNTNPSGGFASYFWIGGGRWYFGYSPVDSSVNACYMGYRQPQSAGDVPLIYFSARDYPDSTLRAPGSGACTSGGGIGPSG